MQQQRTAKAGDGATVTFTEETAYPFGETVKLTIKTDRPADFPLYLRLPRWCAKPALRVNRRPIPLSPAPRGYAVIRRQWRSGDLVSLELPMPVLFTVWRKNHNALSLSRGPLSFSLDIGEKWKRIGGRDAWPDWEVTPTTPWNYGLLTDNPVVKKRSWKAGVNPFTPETAPIELRVHARRIPSWQVDTNGLAANPPSSPAASDQPVETVKLIPMGAARLRISMFPAAP